jgi:type IV secretory pathway TraG/TraD family ATPase VirD4
MLERGKAQAIAEEQRREQEKQADEARAELRRQQEKLATIEAFHDNQLSELRFEVGEFQHLFGETSLREATLRIAQESQSNLTKDRRALNLKLATQGDARGALLFGQLASLENNLRDKSQARGVADGMRRFVIRRTLASMTEAERATLRMADVLMAVGQIGVNDRLLVAVPIVWNGGECAYDFEQGPEFRERSAMLEVLKQLMAASLGTSAGARETLNQAVRAALDEARGLPAEQRQIIERYLFSGNRWMSEAEGQRALARGDLSASALRIGGFPGGSGELLYDLRESLITIAPSGSGKSQAHVLRNLLYLKAPAVVLDIKGEMSAASQQWRERELGKTYTFAPREPEKSFHYNPLDDIGTDPDQAWEDARTVADLMCKPSAKTRDDAYFEGRARDLLTTALLDVALAQTGAKRNMASVLELLYTSDDEEVLAWCKRLERRKSTQLKLQASALRGMPVKQRESLLDTARRHVEIWQSPSVLKVTGDTTFNAASIRAENATVYLKVTLEDVERYASVLRVLIGQLLLKLYRIQPESDAPLVTFFLDELPRLGRLDVIEQSLDMGRGYGVRLWLFCQNLGQLQTAYPNAQGMMSNCAIRCFMNPDEDAARWLAENLGTRHGLLDGTRKPLVEAHQLTGPEFANQVVAFSRGQLPARLDKKPAFADPVCKDRIEGVNGPGQPAAVPSPVQSPVNAPTAHTISPADEPVNWDEVRGATPAPLLSTSPTSGQRGFNSWQLVGAGLAVLLTVAGLIAWLGGQRNELQALRAEKESLAAGLESAEQARQRLAGEKAMWIESLRISEQGHEKFRAEAESVRKVLDLERKDHAATRERLASVHRELEVERARAAARVVSPTPQVALAPAAPPAPAPVVPEATPELSAPSDPSSIPAVQPLDAGPSTPSALQGAQIPPWPSQAPWGAQKPWARTGVAPTTPPSTDCDVLAGNPSDPRRVGAGVKYPDLKRNTAAAIQACDMALLATPNELRFLYQKARALYAANDPRARAIFDELMNAGYPSAFDNAAQYLIRENRMQEAEGLLRRGVQLQDPDAMVSLADAIRTGAMSPRAANEEVILYRIAAGLGHQGARNYVDQMQAGNPVWRSITR